MLHRFLLYVFDGWVKHMEQLLNINLFQLEMLLIVKIEKVVKSSIHIFCVLLEKTFCTNKLTFSKKDTIICSSLDSWKSSKSCFKSSEIWLITFFLFHCIHILLKTLNDFTVYLILKLIIIFNLLMKRIK